MLPCFSESSHSPAENLRSEKLGLRRGSRWLWRELDLRLHAGDFLVIMGPSGSGKSSLMQCLAGLLEPTEGRVVRPSSCSGAGSRGRTGLVLQNLQLVPNLTLLDNALCGCLGQHACWRTLCGFPSCDRRRAADLLCALGLGGRLQARAAEVSGGEQQRTAVARALLQNPSLILADEPVSQLDPALARQVLQRLRQQADHAGTTVVCVLHQEDLAAEFADTLLRLSGTEPASWTLTTRQPSLAAAA